MTLAGVLFNGILALILYFVVTALIGSIANRDARSEVAWIVGGVLFAMLAVRIMGGQP